MKLKVTLSFVGEYAVVVVSIGYCLTITKLTISRAGCEVEFWVSQSLLLQMSGTRTDGRTSANVSRTPSEMANRLSRRDWCA